MEEIGQISISAALYERLRAMAEQRGTTVAEQTERWIEALVVLPESDRDLAFGVVRLLARRGDTRADSWINVVEVAVDRANA